MKAITKYVVRSEISQRHFKAIGETGFALCSWKKATHFDNMEQARAFIRQAGITWHVEIFPVHLTPELGCTVNAYKK